MTAKFDVENMAEAELRALVLKRREDVRRRGQVYRQHKEEAGQVRFSVFIPANRLGDVRRCVADCLRDQGNETDETGSTS